MKKKPNSKFLETKTTPSKINESTKVTFFSSFEEESEYTAKNRAETSYDLRMINIEILRKSIFHAFLLPDNTWPPISKKFKIMEPYSNEISQ